MEFINFERFINSEPCTSHLHHFFTKFVASLALATNMYTVCVQVKSEWTLDEAHGLSEQLLLISIFFIKALVFS